VGESSERMVIDQVVDRLSRSYPGIRFETVAHVVNGCYARFDDSPIRDFVPLFVERAQKNMLAKTARCRSHRESSRDETRSTIRRCPSQVGASVFREPGGRRDRSALVDEVLASGTDAVVIAEIAHRTSILPMVVNGLGRAVMPSSWTQTARRSGARVQTIVPETHLQVAAVSRRSHLITPATALMVEARI
jgi:hypothetical protein